MIKDLVKRINKKTLALSGSETIDKVIHGMIQMGVSSALVVEHETEIKGIVTERDIMRKLSVLDMNGKLEKPIRALMTVPVEFAYLDTLMADIKRMHFENKRRHFPVLKNRNQPAVIDNFVGILTATDICRAYLDSNR